MIRTKILPAANSVASGKTATIDLPVGIRYHKIGLVWGYDGSNAGKETVGGTAAEQIIGDIKVLLNGVVQRQFTAKQLSHLNIAYGSEFQTRTSGSAGSSGYREYVPLLFAEPFRKDTRQQSAMAWNCHPDDVRSFQLQVTFETITTPILQGYYEFDELTGRLGIISKVFRRTFPAVGTTVESALLGMPPGDFLQALHFFATSDGKFVNRLKLTANGAQILEEIDYLENRARNFQWGLNPDTNAYAADPTYLSPRFDLAIDVDDPLQSALPLANINELTFKATLDGAASGTIDALIVRAGTRE